MIDVVDKMTRSRDDGRNQGAQTGSKVCTAPSRVALSPSRGGAFRSSRYPVAKALRGNPGAWLRLASA